MNAKPWYLSKTLWLNFCAIAVFAVQTLQGEPWFDPKAQAVVLALANFGVRLLTGQPVSVKGAGNLLAVLALAGMLTLPACNLAWMSGFGLTLGPAGVTLAYSSPDFQQHTQAASAWVDWLATAPLDQAHAAAPGVAAYVRAVAQAVDQAAGLAAAQRAGQASGAAK
jgi:hypothetical protein